MTVNMKIDLVGRKRRGLVGIVTGYLAATFGLKLYPFYLGIAFAIVGLLISFVVVKDTRKFTRFIPSNFNNYFEPFLGGGYFFYHLLRKVTSRKFHSFLSDTNYEIINSYNTIRNRVEEFIDH